MIKCIDAGSYTAKINIDEALSFMGVPRKANCDENFIKTVHECEKILISSSNFKACYTEFDLNFEQDKGIVTPFGRLQSKNLYEHICDCNTCACFCATIGIGADKLIKSQGIASPLKSVIYDGLASSLIESWCDYVNAVIAGDFPAKSRFSPGYGDFDISYQKRISGFLDTYRYIGVSVTDYMMMTPTKSVTAVIGIKK